MEKIYLPPSYFIKIFDHKILFEGNYVYKYTMAKSNLDYLEENRSKLLLNNYALANAYVYINQKYYSEFYGFRMKNYQNYHNLSELPKYYIYEVIKNIIASLEELKSIDVVYWDVHKKNILVNDAFDVKLLDMDSIKIGIDAARLRNQIYNLVDLIIEMYFNIEPIDFMKCANLDCIDKEVKDYITNVFNRDEYQLGYDISKVAKEFSDPEKRQKVLCNK